MDKEVRVAFWLPDDIHRKIKAQAALDGKTLSQWMTDAIRKTIEKGEE